MAKAAVAIGIQIDGLQETIDFLTKEVPREAQNLSASAVQAAAMTLKKEIAPRIPKRTGKLKKSIKAKRNRPSWGMVSSDVFFDAKGWYWRFVEYGTERAAAHPFVQPAVENFSPRLASIFREQVLVKLEQLRARKAKRKNK